MVTRYLPITKFYDNRKQANTIKKILQAKNPTQKLRVAGNASKSAFRVEVARKF